MSRPYPVIYDELSREIERLSYNDKTSSAWHVLQRYKSFNIIRAPKRLDIY